MDIIHSSAFYLKHGAAGTGLFPSLGGTYPHQHKPPMKVNISTLSFSTYVVA
jgi:hypothetical protein